MDPRLKRLLILIVATVLLVLIPIVIGYIVKKIFPTSPYFDFGNFYFNYWVLGILILSYLTATLLISVFIIGYIMYGFE